MSTSLGAFNCRRVPLPFRKVSIRHLLWKTFILDLSISHHSGHLLMPATKAKYSVLCLSINCFDSYRKKTQYNVFCTYITNQLSHLDLLFPFLSVALSALLTVQAVHRWYSRLRQNRNIVVRCNIFFLFIKKKTPNLYIWRCKETQIIWFTLDILPDNLNPVKCSLMTWI